MLQSQIAQSNQRKYRLGRYLASVASWLELLIAGVVFVGLAASCVPFVKEMLGLFTDGSAEKFHEFLGSALYLVIGIEFIEMLTRHSPGSALEVLMFALVRHMLVGHAGAVENLLSVMAVGIIFLVRKFAFSSSFGEEIDPSQEG